MAHSSYQAPRIRAYMDPRMAPHFSASRSKTFNLNHGRSEIGDTIPLLYRCDLQHLRHLHISPNDISLLKRITCVTISSSTFSFPHSLYTALENHMDSQIDFEPYYQLTMTRLVPCGQVSVNIHHAKDWRTNSARRRNCLIRYRLMNSSGSAFLSF